MFQDARLIASTRPQHLSLCQLRVPQQQRHRCTCQTAVPEDPPAETPEPPGNPLFSAQFQEALKGMPRGLQSAMDDVADVFTLVHTDVHEQGLCSARVEM